MQESMMIAEVGGMLNVSGNRIATPFAPPRPGSTPISTPSRIPTSMKPRFFNVRATAKPCRRLPMSSTRFPRLESGANASEAQQVLERAFRQRHEEPELEEREQD